MVTFGVVELRLSLISHRLLVSRVGRIFLDLEYRRDREDIVRAALVYRGEMIAVAQSETQTSSYLAWLAGHRHSEHSECTAAPLLL